MIQSRLSALPRCSSDRLFLYRRRVRFSQGTYIGDNIAKVIWIPGLNQALVSKDKSWKLLTLSSLSPQELNFYLGIQNQIEFLLPKDPKQLMGERVSITFLNSVILSPSDFKAMQKIVEDKEGLLAKKANVEQELCLKQKELETVVTNITLE